MYTSYYYWPSWCQNSKTITVCWGHWNSPVTGAIGSYESIYMLRFWCRFGLIIMPHGTTLSMLIFSLVCTFWEPLEQRLWCVWRCASVRSAWIEPCISTTHCRQWTLQLVCTHVPTYMQWTLCFQQMRCVVYYTAGHAWLALEYLRTCLWIC